MYNIVVRNARAGVEKRFAELVEEGGEGNEGENEIT